MGAILFVLFLIAAAIGVYVFFRHRNVPIGHVGVVTFLNTRTNRIFSEGDYVLPPFCRVVDEDVMDKTVTLDDEDAPASDGVNIVFKRPFIRYRLTQIPRVRGKSRFQFPFFRRLVPFRMDDTLAEYLNIRGVLATSMQEVAHDEINTFTTTVPHAKLLGYNVAKLPEQLMAGATLDDVKSKESDTPATRARLRTALKERFIASFAYAGIEVMDVAFPDIDTTDKDKVHIDAVVVEIEKQQLEKIRSKTEVIRTLTIADAIHTYQQEHPQSDFAATYQMMRGLDIQQTAADGSSFIGLILQGLAGTLQKTAAPAVPPTPSAPVGTPVTV